MQIRRLGQLWPVSYLTLGGGGLSQLWATTSRDEAVATSCEAIVAGINLLDVASRYGDGEAARVVGDAFGGRLPEAYGSDQASRQQPPGRCVFDRPERSLEQILERMRLQHVDLFFLHGYLIGSKRDRGERHVRPPDLSTRPRRGRGFRLQRVGKSPGQQREAATEKGGGRMLHHKERPATALAHGPAKPDDIDRVRRDVETAAEASAEPRVDRALGEIEAACDTIRDDVEKLKRAIAPEHGAAAATRRSR